MTSAKSTFFRRLTWATVGLMAAATCMQAEAGISGKNASEPVPGVQAPHYSPSQILAIRSFLAKKATALGLPAQPDISEQLEFARQTVLIRALLNQYVHTHPVTAQQIQARYEAEREAYGPTQVHVAQIFVSTQKQADEVLVDLRSGTSFSVVARNLSLDAATARNGGDLGWVSPRQLLAPIRDALDRLKPGEYSSAPIQSAKGWHIVKLEGRRNSQFPALSAVSEEVKRQLEQQEVQQYLAQLIAEAGVKP